MNPKTRPLLIGAALAVVVVVVAIAVAALAAFVARGGAVKLGTRAAPDKVVVVFAMQDEQRTVVAQTIAVVDAATGSFETADTSATVSIPGTSYTLLRDAYPFGGAKAVATALDDGVLKPGTAWVEVTPDAWKRLLKAGVDVTITESFETFDEVTERYTEFVDGPNHVAADDLWGLVNGVAYLSAGERSTIIDALARASLRELAAASPGQGITTDLTPEQWRAFVKVLQGK